MNTSNPYAPPQAAVRDLAAPDGASALAGRGTRLVASMLDGLVIAVMIYIPLGIGLALNGRPIVLSGGHFNTAALLGAGSWLPVIGLLVWGWLTILFVSRNGQSIGKKMLGIKVIRSDGSPASLSRIFLLRNVVNAVLSVLPLYGLVDLLLIFGEKRQCVHDKIADTIVIKA
jgi:uncharacterized RDD family membrane protein YckC